MPNAHGISWDGLRRACNEAAALDGEWAGAPMPVHGIPLVIEPRYPYAGLNGFCLDGDGPRREGEAVVVHNSWYSHKHSAIVYVCSDTPEGPRFHLMLPEWGGPRLGHWVGTLGASSAWSVHAELRAVETLGDLISPTAYRSYLLTGTFLETSRRSGVQYLFRKLRPTIALRGARDGGTRILSVLCLHPIGYYEGTWAGAMVPTDDVISHLLLMRGDEHRFWGKANHHPLWSAAAGI